MRIIADQAWYGTDTGERVPRRHPLARFLIVSEGCEIEENDLLRYPIHKEKTHESKPKPVEKAIEKPVVKQIEKPPQTKDVRRPPATKSKKPKR